MTCIKDKPDLKKYRTPVLTDSMVNRFADGSLDLVKRAIMEVGRETVQRDSFPEEWFERPYRVAEKLGDRLAVAESCIRKPRDWDHYRGLLKEMDLGY